MTGRRFDWSYVADLVLESLRGSDVRERCRQAGVARATFYRRRAAFVNGGRARLAELAQGRTPPDGLAGLRQALRRVERERDRLRGENILLRARVALRCEGAGRRRSLTEGERRAVTAVVRASGLGVRRAMRVLGIPRSTYYTWGRRGR